MIVKVKIADIVNRMSDGESKELSSILCLLFQEIGRRLFEIERSKGKSSGNPHS